MVGTNVSFQFRNEQFFAMSRKSRDCAEAYIWYVAQAIQQIDTDSAVVAKKATMAKSAIAKNGHFWMETNWPVPSKRDTNLVRDKGNRS